MKPPDSVRRVASLLFAAARLAGLAAILTACLDTATGGRPAEATPTSAQPVATPTVVPASLPETPTPTAVVIPIRGHRKSLSLDCEARSAVDWAAFFDVRVDELELQARLPRSLSPDEGYVGDPHDDWGHMPPQSYGVHAGPLAGELRRYGLKAYPYRSLSWDHLRAELDAGYPAIVWVVGRVQDLGGATTYAAPNGRKSLVAPYEHTVILAGYQGDDTVFLLDGAQTYTRPLDTFLASWKVLGNMAILAHQVIEPGVDPL